MEINLTFNSLKEKKSTTITLKQLSKELWRGDGLEIIAIDLDSFEFQIKKISKDLNEFEEKNILEYFLAQYQLLVNDETAKKINGFDTEEEESPVERPNFDPELIRIDPKMYSSGEIVRFIDNGDLDISPDFQRNFVWDSKRKSRLIESLMLRIPLPMFYLAQDKDGVSQVVDGSQRLTTIYEFSKNKFILKDLEYLADCEGKMMKDLEGKYRRRIEQALFSFNVIDPSTPVSVKFELFKRVNQGGNPLNSQEIRNSMAKPETRNLLNELANMPSFKIATNDSVKSLRMDDQDLVMRFIGFYFWKFKKMIDYRGDMEVFLDDVLDKLNQKEIQMFFPDIKIAFNNAMENAAFLFGKFAFRKCKSEHLKFDAKKQLINKSLFTIWSVLLASYNPEVISSKNQIGALNLPMADILEKDDKYFFELWGENDKNFSYFDSVTTGTNQTNKLEFGFKVANYLIESHVKTK